MKIIHTSDIHFGVENYARLDPATGLSTRLLDFVRAFERVVDYAVAERADALIFTGDAYKNRDPNPTHQREFARLIRKLTQGGVAVFLLTGNHDLPNMTSRAHSLEIFDTLAVPLVTVGRRIGLYTLQTRSGLLQVVGLPWVTRSALFAREENRNLSMRELDDVMQQRIGDALDGHIGTLDKSLPTVLAAHATIDGATVGSEQMIMLGPDLSLPRSMVNRPDVVQYVALGHIHKHQALSKDADLPLIYAGSIERVDFGERNDPKGFIEIDITKGAGGWEAVPTFRLLPARIFYEYELDIRQLGAQSEAPARTKKSKVTAPDIFDEIGLDPSNGGALSLTDLVVRRLETQAEQDGNAYASANPDKQTQIKHFDGAVFRLKLLMNAEQEAALRVADVQKALERLGVSYIAGIGKEVADRTDRVRLAGVNVAELTPTDLLRLYFEEHHYEPKRIDTLLNHASTLMNFGGHDC